MPRQPRICPACSQPVRRSYRAVGGVRYHLACVTWQVGRPPGGPESRGDEARVRVQVSLTADELAVIDSRRGDVPRAVYLRLRALA